MTEPKQKLKHGGSRKHGRNKKKCQQYATAKTREYNKLRRILQSNGQKAANQYVETHGLKWKH